MKSDPVIACILFRRVGDSLLATPAIRALHTSFPNSSITVFAESQVLRVFEGISHVQRVVDCGESFSTYRLVRHLRELPRCSMVVDFLSDPRSALACAMSGAETRAGIGSTLRSRLYTHRIKPQDPTQPLYSARHKLLLAEAVGAKEQGEDLELSLLNVERQWAKQLWENRGWEGSCVVAVFPTSRRAYKCWPTEKYAELCAALVKGGGAVPVLIGAVSELEALRATARRSGLQESHIITCPGIGYMAAILAQARLLIGNDGGPKHLACATRTPTVTIFRSDHWKYWTPPNDPRHLALTDYDGCLSVDSVLKAANQMLSTIHG